MTFFNFKFDFEKGNLTWNPLNNNIADAHILEREREKEGVRKK